MESSQESLFTDETKGGIEVIYSKFIDQRRMDYKSLFGGFDHLKVITFSYGLGFVETVSDMFEDVEIIIGSMNTVRPDIVEVAMHQKLEMKRLSKRKRLVERVKDGSVRIYFNMRKMSHEKLSSCTPTMGGAASSRVPRTSPNAPSRAVSTRR